MNENEKTLAQKALELLDTEYDFRTSGEYPEDFLKNAGFELKSNYELEDTVYGNPRYQKTNFRWEFEDGSLLDEEMEMSFADASAYEDHLAALGEAAEQRAYEAFHAGEGPLTEQEKYMKAWEQKQELHARPPLASVDEMSTDSVADVHKLAQQEAELGEVDTTDHGHEGHSH